MCWVGPKASWPVLLLEQKAIEMVTPAAGAADIATYLAALAAALIVALTITVVARRVAIRFGLLDRPSERKTHGDPTPYLGGLGIVIAFIAAAIVAALIRGIEGQYDEIAVMLGGGLAVAAVGLWDDVRPLPVWIKVIVIVPLAAILYVAGIRAELFGVWQLNLVLTVGWVVGIVNAVNFLDNMDGLTAGVASIAGLYLAALSALSGQVYVASLSAAVAGSALGFLWHNRPSARIFMGDSGSLFLGWLLAALAMKPNFENLRRVTFFVPIAILAVPIFDTLMVSTSRIIRGLSPLRPGLDHTSHRLVRLGFSRSAAVGVHYLAAVGCGWLGVVIAFAQPATAYMVMGWIVALAVFLGFLCLKSDWKR